MEYYQANALRITQLMKQNHMTAYELAKQSGIPHSTISLILSGKTKKPRSLTMINIGRGFNMSIREYYNSELFNTENIDDN